MRLVLDMDDEDIEEYGEMIYEYQIASNFSASAENEVGGLASKYRVRYDINLIPSEMHLKHQH